MIFDKLKVGEKFAMLTSVRTAAEATGGLWLLIKTGRDTAFDIVNRKSIELGPDAEVVYVQDHPLR